MRNKKFMLNIPNMIRKEDAYLAEEWKVEEDDGVIRDDWPTCIPSDWFEEVKDGPIDPPDFSSVIKSAMFPIELTSKKTCYYFGFIDGEKNNEIRHLPQQTFEEWQNERKHGFAATAHEAWQASARNLGHE